ncbi:MAG: ribonuclease III [Terriglobales bacterium]
MRSEEITSLEERIGHRFRDRELLERALTHSSHAHEREAGSSVRADNEQLEFLGDAVLGFVVSRLLCERFPNFHEGQLSKLRAHLVSARHLGGVAQRLELGRFLRLGRGEERSGGRSKSALLVNALEALLAAVYLDAGLETAHELIRQKIFEPELGLLQEQAGGGLPTTDHKSALQESLQARALPPPRYSVVMEHGPDHRKVFTVELRLRSAEGEQVYRAQGSTKKEAEQDAARQALEKLQ